MKKGAIIFIIAALLICSCGNSNTKPKVNEAVANNTGNVKRELFGKLTMSMPIYFGSIVNLVEDFKKENPNVEIEIRSCNEEGEAFPVDNMNVFYDYVLMMATDVMSENDVDIYETSYLPYFKYVKSGAFEDLYSYMNTDQLFRTEDYYTNVFEALSYDGKLCVLPTHFDYNIVRFNTKYVNELDENKLDVDYRDIEKMYVSALSNNQDIKLDFSCINSAFSSDFNNIELSGRMNIKNETIVIDSEAFGKYLDFSKKYLNHEGYVMGIDDYVEVDPEQNPWFANYLPFHIIGLNEKTTEVTKPYLVSASTGDLPFNPIGGMYSISTNSNNKELSWEFLKYLIEEKNYDFDSYEIKEYEKNIEGYIAYVPVNKNNFRKTAFDIWEKKFNRDVSEDVEYWDGINSVVNCIMFSDVELNDIIYSVLNEYENDIIDQSECIKQLQEKVQIYLDE